MQRDCNGLGQLITEYQERGGAVNAGASPKVQYAYTEMSGGANHSRLTSMTYPNGFVVNYDYSSGLCDTISRLSSLSDASETLESYSYLGLGTVVIRSHPQPGVDLTHGISGVVFLSLLRHVTFIKAAASGRRRREGGPSRRGVEIHVSA